MQLVPDGGVGGVEAVEEPEVAVPLAEASVTSVASPAPVKRGRKHGNHQGATGTDETMRQKNCPTPGNAKPYRSKKCQRSARQTQTYPRHAFQHGK
jgi:hypothetical protein